MAQTITDLLGETFTEADPYGEDLVGPDLTNGYIGGRSVDHVCQVVIGDGLAGPVNDQQFQIQRDNRTLAVDELGKQGPFQLEIGKYARHRAGRMFPLNDEFGPAGLDSGLVEMVPEQDVLSLSPFSPSQYPEWGYGGVSPAEVVPSARTVFYTASQNVGWDGY